MWNGGSAPSLADIAAVTSGNRNNDDGLTGNGGIWVLIILFALFGGWGNRGGYGGNDGGGGSNVSAEIQRGFDTQAVISKLDGLNNGVCSLGYDQLAQMNGIDKTIMQTGFNLQSALNQAFNALTAQTADCCCKQERGQLQIMNQMDRDTCDITTAIDRAAQNIMQNCNNNYQRLHDENVQARLDAKDETISELRSRLTRCDNRNDVMEIVTQVLGQINGNSNWGRSGCRECGSSC